MEKHIIKNEQKLKTFEREVKEDEEYFKKQVEKGIKKLAGARTEERVRNCIHCKLWSRAEKFIEEVLK